MSGEYISTSFDEEILDLFDEDKKGLISRKQFAKHLERSQIMGSKLTN